MANGNGNGHKNGNGNGKKAPARRLSKHGLNPKQRRFIAEYMRDQNGTQAAIRAGYSEKTADRLASRLLGKVEVQQAIEKRLSQYEVTAERVTAELAKIGFSNMLDYVRVQEDGDAYVDLSEVTRDQAAAIQELTSEDYIDGRGEDGRQVRRTKIKVADKRGALELLGKTLKLFSDRVEVTGDGELLAALAAGRARAAGVEAEPSRSSGT